MSEEQQLIQNNGHMIRRSMVICSNFCVPNRVPFRSHKLFFIFTTYKAVDNIPGWFRVLGSSCAAQRRQSYPSYFPPAPSGSEYHRLHSYRKTIIY